MIDECLKVTFEIESDGCPLADGSKVVGGAVEAKPPQLRSDGTTLLKFSASRSERFRQVLDEDERIHFLHVAESGENDIFRCVSTRPCVVHELVDDGLLVDSLQYRDGQAVVSGAIVDREVLKRVVDRPEENPTVRLRQLSAIQTQGGEITDRPWDTTERQEECLRCAVEMGYFSIPRQANAEEVASNLGISKSAFLERLRRAEQEIFENTFL